MNTELVLSIVIGTATLVLGAVAVVVSVGAVVAYNVFKQQAVEAAQKTAKDEMRRYFQKHNIPMLVAREVQKAREQELVSPELKENEKDKL